MSQKVFSKTSLSSSLSLLVLILCSYFSACSSKPPDMRTLVPAETLVYLETNDLAAALQPIVDAKPFMEVAKSKPDFSALKGVQLAVAVTGFETSEEKLTDEHSIGRVQPRFVAVAETHAWNYQAVAFAEKKLGSFVANIYDSEPTLEKTDKNGGKYFTWTARDGRKAYALVIDSIIYFGNDETSIDKCLAVKRGETDSILKTGKIPVASPEVLASGYVSTDGIAQIANLVGLKFASEAADESEIQSAIAGILPRLIRGTVTDVSWTMTRGERGIEDNYAIRMPAEIANVFSETIVFGHGNDEVLNQLPADSTKITVYHIEQPNVAWDSLLMTARKVTDPVAGKVIAEFSKMFFESYGIRTPSTFLGSVGYTIVTTRLGDDDDQVAVIATVDGKGGVEASFLETLIPDKKPFGSANLERWSDLENDMAAVFVGQWVIVGDSQSVTKCNEEKPDGGFLATPYGKAFNATKATVKTFGRDSTTAPLLVLTLAREGHSDTKAVSTYITETRFTKTGIDRRTISDFGLIGSIIAQLRGEGD